jgi:predicted nucleotide-binding protein
LIAELAEYETKLAGVRDRFTKTREGIWIGDGDDANLLQYVREIIDLLDSALGRSNPYSRQISDYYDDGLRNMYGCPSLRSVRNIVSLLKAAQTGLKRRPVPMPNSARGSTVFIGHGRSKEWKDLKDFISERMQLPWEEFSRETAAGIPTVTRLAKMLDTAAIAFLVLTAEDERADGRMQARMNVIHEAGLFQGRLGFERAIIMLEEGCDDFSNIHGLGHISFGRGNIQSAFYEVQRVLEREEIAPAHPSGRPSPTSQYMPQP